MEARQSGDEMKLGEKYIKKLYVWGLSSADKIYPRQGEYWRRISCIDLGDPSMPTILNMRFSGTMLFDLELLSTQSMLSFWGYVHNIFN